MKKMDELDRSIRLRSEEVGFKAAILALAAASLWECWNKIFGSGAYNPLPVLALLAVLCVQGFAELAMKRQMIAGDDEYREPNKLVRRLLGLVVAAAVILSLGAGLLFGQG